MQFQSTSTVRTWITNTAKIWHQSGKLSTREFDDLNYTLERCPETSSPIEWLLDQNSPFLEMLTLWYGPSGIGSNLIRLGIQPYLKEIQSTLHSWQENMILQAKKNFNRVVCVGDQEGFDATILYSALLGDCAEILNETLKNSHKNAKKISTLHGCTLAGAGEIEIEIDKKIAESLQLQEPENNRLPMSLENQFRKNLHNNIDTLLQWTQSFYLEVTGSSNHLHWSNTMMYGEELAIHTSRLASMKIPTHSHLAQWDLYRKNIEKTLSIVAVELKNFSEAFYTALLQLDSYILNDKKNFPGAIQRRVAWEHIEKGLAPKQATQAVSQLADYLHKNTAIPEQLIHSEIQHIHPDLHIDTLPRITSLKKDHQQNPNEKKLLVARFEALSKSLLIAIAMVLSSCGVKTAPMNSIVEPTPKFPWEKSATPLHEGLETKRDVEQPQN